MPEAKSKSFAESILGRTTRPGEEEPETVTRDRQGNVEAFSLEVKFKDGRRRQTFPWQLYGGHEWTEENDAECLTVLFGMRVLIVRGHRLENLNRDIALGKLTSIRQHNSQQVQLLRNENPEGVPVIVDIEAYPRFAQIVNDIKGEEERDTGFAGKAGR